MLPCSFIVFSFTPFIRRSPKFYTVLLYSRFLCILCSRFPAPYMCANLTCPNMNLSVVLHLCGSCRGPLHQTQALGIRPHASSRIHLH